MRVCPDLLLGEVQQARQHDQENHHLQAGALARLEMRLRGPHQERRDVLGVLLHRRRRAVVERHLTVAERLRHLDRVAGEDVVVVGAFRQREARRRLVLIPLQQRVDVIRALLLELDEGVEHELRKAALVTTSLRDQRQVCG